MSFKNSFYFKISLWYFLSVFAVLLIFSFFVYIYTSNYMGEKALGLLRWGLFVSFPVGLLFSLVGIFILRRTLNPLYIIIEHMKTIDADILENVLPEDKALSDELRILVNNYNEMLMRLQKSFDKLRELGVNVSHQLRTPLTILQGEIEVALREERSVPYYKEILESNLEEIRRMISAIEKLLLLGKLKSGVYPLEEEDVSLEELIRNIVNRLKKIIEDRNLVFSIIAPGGIILKSDSFLLENLFMNLIDNAIKHSVEHGKILIKLKKEDGVEVEIRNLFVGKLPDDINKIFDRYYSRGRGGLGLAIVYEIVKVLDGSIDASVCNGNEIAILINLP